MLAQEITDTGISMVTAVAAILTSLGVGAILTAVISGLFGRGKAKAEAAAIIGDTARELLQPLRDRMIEMGADEKRMRHRIEDLEADLRWLRAERADQIRRDTAMQHHLMALNTWTQEWLPRARSLGLEVPDPPLPPNLMPLIDPTQMLQPPPHRNHSEDTTRRRMRDEEWQ